MGEQVTISNLQFKSKSQVQMIEFVKVGLVGSCFSPGKPPWCGLEGAALEIQLFTEGHTQLHHCQQAYETTRKNSVTKSQAVDS